MNTLINNSVIDTVSVLVGNMKRQLEQLTLKLSTEPTNFRIKSEISNLKLWLDKISLHLSNRRPNDSYPKYDVSRLKWILKYLGPRYLLE